MESEMRQYPGDESFEMDVNQEKAAALKQISELEEKQRTEGLSETEQDILKTLKDANELVE
jgi:hypothetical protein